MKVEIHEGFPNIEVIINCPQKSEETQKIVAMLQNCDRKMSGKKDGYVCRIDQQDVLYFESVDKHCFFYTDTDIYETDMRLYEIEELLTNADFFRGSKSLIINLAKVSSLCPDFDGRMEVVMKNSEKLIVSRQYAKTLKERLGLK